MTLRKTTEALIHRASNYPDLLPKMPKYAVRLKFFYMTFKFKIKTFLIIKKTCCMEKYISLERKKSTIIKVIPIANAEKLKWQL